MTDLVEAAGGVVIRGGRGDREVLVIHRPAHDDWTLPKGKLEDGERHEQAAIREVEEETGWMCALGPLLSEARYVDANGRPKRVRYWLMRPESQEGWSPTREVDDVRWVSVTDAEEALSHGADRTVLEAAVALDEPIFLVRHAKAAPRETWPDDDDLRPLTPKGLRQAERLRDHLGLGSVRHVSSSPATRCVQTVEPLARELDVPLEMAEALREGTPARSALRYVGGLPGPSVACTHGDILVGIVESIASAKRAPGPAGWKKGSTWILDRDGGQLIGARYVAPARDRAD